MTNLRTARIDFPVHGMLSNFHRLFDRVFLSIFRKYPLLIWLGIIALLGEFGYGIVLATLPLFLVDTFGKAVHVAGAHLATVKLVTYVVAVFAVTETVSQLFMGGLGDRLGRRPVALFGVALSGCAPALMTVLRWPLLFLPVRILDGVGAASLWPNINALAGDWTEEQDRATAMSVISTCRMLGLALGPSTGLYIASITHSNRDPFVASFLLFAILLGLCAFAFPHQSRTGTRLASSSLRNPKSEIHNASGWFHDSLQVLRERPALVTMMLTYTVLQFGVTLPAPIIPIYAKHFLRFSERQMSLAFLVPALTVGVISIPLARAADKFGKVLAIRAALVICAVGMCIVPFLRQLLPIMAIIGVLATAYAWGTPAWTGLTSVLAPVDRQGLVMGMMSAARGIGFCLGPIVGGEAWARFGPQAPYFCSAGLFSLCLIAVLLLVKTEWDEGLPLSESPDQGA